MPIDPSAEKRRILLQTLHEELGRSKAEINRTDAHDFKEELEASETALALTIGRLEADGG